MDHGVAGVQDVLVPEVQVLLRMHFILGLFAVVNALDPFTWHALLVLYDDLVAPRSPHTLMVLHHFGCDIALGVLLDLCLQSVAVPVDLLVIDTSSLHRNMFGRPEIAVMCLVERRKHTFRLQTASIYV